MPAAESCSSRLQLSQFLADVLKLRKAIGNLDSAIDSIAAHTNWHQHLSCRPCLSIWKEAGVQENPSRMVEAHVSSQPPPDHFSNPQSSVEQGKDQFWSDVAGKTTVVGGVILHPEDDLDREYDFQIACAKLGSDAVIGGLSALFHYNLIEQAPK